MEHLRKVLDQCGDLVGLDMQSSEARDPTNVVGTESEFPRRLRIGHRARSPPSVGSSRNSADTVMYRAVSREERKDRKDRKETQARAPSRCRQPEPKGEAFVGESGAAPPRARGGYTKAPSKQGNPRQPTRAKGAAVVGESGAALPRARGGFAKAPSKTQRESAAALPRARGGFGKENKATPVNQPEPKARRLWVNRERLCREREGALRKLPQ